MLQAPTPGAMPHAAVQPVNIPQGTLSHGTMPQAPIPGSSQAHQGQHHVVPGHQMSVTEGQSGKQIMSAGPTHGHQMSVTEGQSGKQIMSAGPTHGDTDYKQGRSYIDLFFHLSQDISYC